MNVVRSQTRQPAFTVIELLAIIVVIFFLVVVFAPGEFFSHRMVTAPRIHCVNNLKQVGLAFRMWSDDNSDKYPQNYIGNPQYPLLSPMNDYTTMLGLPCEYTYLVFASMSNELSTPKIMVCPADGKRTAATNFTSDFDNSHLSYFAGLDANSTNPTAFLAGDRNITNGWPLINGILYLRSNQNLGWSSELHNQTGNIGLADGSVQQVPSVGLKRCLTNSGLARNRILLP
jgi:hypothetical protein